MKILRTVLRALALAMAAGWLAGCATDSNDSSMPWNTPQSWEGPLPSTINQGR
jgi:type IV secretory pathway VirB2 component (pilin)